MENIFGKLNAATNFGRMLMIFAAVLFVLTGCRDQTATTADDVPTREIIDDLGRTIKIPLNLERAVSLAPNLTENAFAVGAGGKLVGVTTYCDFPEDAKKIQKIGDTLNPNMETIIALKPEIVLVSTASQIENFTKTLESQNIQVFVQNPKNLEDVLKNLTQLGEIFGTQTQAAALVGSLQKRSQAIQAKAKNTAKPKIFVQIDKESLYTIGHESFMTDLINRAGGASVTDNLPTAYPKISKETALALNPDVIILSESPNNLEPNEVFKNSDAVKNGKVYKIQADLLSRPSPRIFDGLEQLTADLSK